MSCIELEPAAIVPEGLFRRPSLVLGNLILTRDISHMFRGRANRRWYQAELELHASIAAESCCWELKCNQPVLKLVKQQQGYWERFLRNKVLKFSLRVMVRLPGISNFFLLQNIFVSYDMEHHDSEEDRAPNGRPADQELLLCRRACG